MDLAGCFGQGAFCAIQPECRLIGVLDEALNAFLSVLDRYTLADLVQRPQVLAALLTTEAA
jgi:Rrf2 family nitric oxide-sensitive transcriptional repressor